jgi:predicted RNA-binding Zn-ribbon protein involved in translation (DUF1610 family)
MSMKENGKRGTWLTRQLIRLFTVVLGILFFWMLGFFVEDIEAIPGPNFAEIEHKYVDAKLVEQSDQLQKKIGGLERTIADQSEQQRIVRDSSENLQRTIQQLLQLKKISVEKSASFSDSKLLAASLNEFFESQKNYQNLNQSIASLASEKARLVIERDQVEAKIAKQRTPAEDEYQRLVESHRLRLAFYQLLILVPLLLATAYPLVKRRGSLYYPLFLAIGGATLVQVVLVVHEYFPTRYFKYILIVALLLVVARLLVYLIRTVAFPKIAWLKRQYRENYERFLCPVCEYPIRTGPRKFLYWTRRTVHKVLPQGELSGVEEAYTCPACGTAVFEVCGACKKVRHSLLDHCEHCGAAKACPSDAAIASGGTGS